MGVIKRQGIKNSLVNYAGVGIGAISVIFIYPLINKEELGIIQFIIKAATFLAPVALLGLNLSAIQFFPLFKNKEKNHHGFLFLITVSSVLSVFVTLMGVWLFKTFFSLIFHEQAKYFLYYLPHILVLSSLVAFSYLLNSYISNFNRIVVPAIFFNLFIKIVLPVLILLYWRQFISYKIIFNGIVITYLFVLAGHIWYLYYIKEARWSPDFTFITRRLAKKIAQYSGFNVLLSVGYSIALQVGDLMVGPLTKNFANVAIYNVGFFIAEAIDVPRKALSGVSSPLLSEALEKNDRPTVEMIYKKSALIQLVVGVYLLAGVWACVDYLFLIMPNGAGFAGGKYVILILGIARLTDMATGLNSEIITYSHLYRFNFPSVISLAVFTILGNLLIVPRFGYIGTAWVTLASMVLYNLVKLFFIYQKLGVQPLQWKMMQALIFGFIAWKIADLIPGFSSAILNMVLKGTVVTLTYFLLILLFRISTDINSTFSQMRIKLKKGL